MVEPGAPAPPPCANTSAKNPHLPSPASGAGKIPSYDRAEGLSLPIGPSIALDTGYYEIDPTITYRSNLGAFDPAAEGQFAFGRRTRATVFVGRTTSTNDDWIWSDLVNSAAVFGLGLDTRNYYRADRVEAVGYHTFDAVNMEVEPFVGVRAERDRSVGPDSLATSWPWSIFGRTSIKRMRRPNPAVIRETLRSVIVGGNLAWEAQRVRATVKLTNEAAALV